MKCPYCGNKLPAGAAFCTKCGKKLASDNTGSNVNPPSSSGRKKLILIIIIAAVVLTVIIAVILTTRKSPSDQAAESLKKQLEAGGETLDTDDPGTRIAELIYNNASWEIESAKDGTAVIRVTAPDFYSLYKDMTKNIPDPEDPEEYKNLISELNASLETALSRGKYDMKIWEVSAPVSKDGTVTMTKELTDALYGGLLTLTDELREDYTGGGRG